MSPFLSLSFSLVLSPLNLLQYRLLLINDDSEWCSHKRNMCPAVPFAAFSRDHDLTTWRKSRVALVYSPQGNHLRGFHSAGCYIVNGPISWEYEETMCAILYYAELNESSVLLRDFDCRKYSVAHKKIMYSRREMIRRPDALKELCIFLGLNNNEGNITWSICFLIEAI